MRAGDGEDLLAGYVSGPAAATEATALALARARAAGAVVLVEGVSDQIAVETSAGGFAGALRPGASWSCRSAAPTASPATCGGSAPRGPARGWPGCATRARSILSRAAWP